MRKGRKRLFNEAAFRRRKFRTARMRSWARGDGQTMGRGVSLLGLGKKRFQGGVNLFGLGLGPLAPIAAGTQLVRNVNQPTSVNCKIRRIQNTALVKCVSVGLGQELVVGSNHR